jgi:hypothetical protein
VSETTTSCSYATTSYNTTGWTTSNPSLTLSSSTTTRVLVIVTAQIQPAASGQVWASFAVSGTTTQAASDLNSIERTHGSSGGTGDIRASVMTFVTLTAGSSNLFTMQYKEAGGTATISNRSLTVIPLN